MKNFILLLVVFSATHLQANIDEREGSIIKNKSTGAQIYFTCAIKDMLGECSYYNAFLEEPIGDSALRTQPYPAPTEKILLHSSLYISLLNNKDAYITGEPINLKTYDVTEKFFNKTRGDKFTFGNIVIKAVLSPLTLAVGIVETIIDKPQNIAMKTKAIVLKVKYKKPLKNLFMGKKQKTYEIRNNKFQKLVKLIKKIS